MEDQKRCPLCRDFMPGPNSPRTPTRVNGVLYCDVICAVAATGKIPQESELQVPE